MAALAGRLSSELSSSLADEASGPVGHLLPIPATDGQDSTLTELRGDLAKASGQTLLVEAGDWGAPGGAPGQAAGWEPRRLGAQPPAGLVELHKLASSEVFAACGLSASLFSASSAGAAREGFRQMLFSVVGPLSRMVESELSAKLETPVKLSFDGLMASDISGRARAFQSMTSGGMEVDTKLQSTLALCNCPRRCGGAKPNRSAIDGEPHLSGLGRLIRVWLHSLFGYRLIAP